MRFRGGGVGHSSTRAASDIFKTDRDELDIVSQQARKEPQTHRSIVTDDSDDDGIMVEDDMEAENLDGEIEGDVDEEGQVSDSEVVDYGYELESCSDEEENDDSDVGEEDDY